MPDADHGLPCVARMTLNLPADPRPEEIRDAEAAAVADLCARLVGNLKIPQPDGTTMPLAPGGIALLAPTGWELWRYERALEARGLPVGVGNSTTCLCSSSQGSSTVRRSRETGIHTRSFVFSCATFRLSSSGR